MCLSCFLLCKTLFLSPYVGAIPIFQSMWKPAYDFLLTWAHHVGDSYRDVIQELHLGLDKMRNPITKRWKHLTGTLILVNCLDTLRSAAFCPTGYGDFAVWAENSDRRILFESASGFYSSARGGSYWSTVFLGSVDFGESLGVSATCRSSQCRGNHGTDRFWLSSCKYRRTNSGIWKVNVKLEDFACTLPFYLILFLYHFYFKQNTESLYLYYFVFFTFSSWVRPFFCYSHAVHFAPVSYSLYCLFLSSICSFKFTLRIILETSTTAVHSQTYCELQPFPHLNSFCLHFYPEVFILCLPLTAILFFYNRRKRIRNGSIQSYISTWQ